MSEACVNSADVCTGTNVRRVCGIKDCIVAEMDGGQLRTTSTRDFRKSETLLGFVLL